MLIKDSKTIYIYLTIYVFFYNVAVYCFLSIIWKYDEKSIYLYDFSLNAGRSDRTS